MKLKQAIIHYMYDHHLPFMINWRWQKTYGYKIDWRHPKDINEKMWWLACYGDTSLWPLCADKYRVREFLKQKGMEDLLVGLYGVWGDARDIDFDALPQKFILKCNHDSGTCIIVDKAAGYDKNAIVASLNTSLGVRYGYVNGETYYNKIKPCIVAEEFLEDPACCFSKSLVDYKVWCFDGKPYCTWACYNRTKGSTYVNVYDMDWNVHPEYSVFNDHYRDGRGMVPRPASFERMMSAAATLSAGFPEVRVDFYDVGGRLCFGEMTFTTLFGQIDFYSKEFLAELGDHCSLPVKK